MKGKGIKFALQALKILLTKMSWFKPVCVSLRFIPMYTVDQYCISKPSVLLGYYQNLQVNSIFNFHC